MRTTGCWSAGPHGSFHEPHTGKSPARIPSANSTVAPLCDLLLRRHHEMRRGRLVGRHKHLVCVNSAAVQFASARNVDRVEEFVSRPQHFRVPLGDRIPVVYLVSEDSDLLACGGDHDASGNRAGNGLVPFCASDDHAELGGLWRRVQFWTTVDKCHARNCCADQSI
jgi:hypothetical protein